MGTVFGVHVLVPMGRAHRHRVKLSMCRLLAVNVSGYNGGAPHCRVRILSRV